MERNHSRPCFSARRRISSADGAAASAAWALCEYASLSMTGKKAESFRIVCAVCNSAPTRSCTMPVPRENYILRMRKPQKPHVFPINLGNRCKDGYFGIAVAEWAHKFAVSVARFRS